VYENTPGRDTVYHGAKYNASAPMIHIMWSVAPKVHFSGCKAGLRHE